MGVDNTALAKRYLTEVWDKGNLKVVDELVDENIVLEDPMVPQPVKGIQVVRDRLNEMSNMFSDTNITIKETFASGDTVVIRHQWSGKHVGDFYGIKPTNKRLTCDSIEVIKIKNGKVVENVTYFDAYSMFQQLGVLPPPDQLQRKQTQPEVTARA
jgi:steroid delta-isomerase-like uncharacterized protein